MPTSCYFSIIYTYYLIIVNDIFFSVKKKIELKMYQQNQKTNYTLFCSDFVFCFIINRLIMSQPIYTQRLLTLLFGTFRVIASNSERAGTGMSSEAIGVSVAPSFFQSCVSDGKTARMEDVLRYKVKYIILIE